MSVTPTTGFSFEKLLTTRRSVRVFDRTRVPDDVVRRALDMAFLSPSSSNLQHWQFFRIIENLEAAQECFLKQVPAMTCREIIVAVARPDQWRQTNAIILTHLHAARPPHYDYLVNYHTKSVPFANDIGPLGIKGALKAFINWCIGWRSAVGRGGFFPWRLRSIAIGSTAIACQTLMLAMAEQGYDTCPMGGFDEVRLRKLLKLPRNAVPVMGIAVGKRSPTNVTTEQYRLGYRDKVVEL